MGSVVAVAAVAAVVCAGSLLVACSSGGGSGGGASRSAEQATTTSTKTKSKDRGKPDFAYASATCPMDLPADVQVDCGYLAVPENREVSTSNTIKLAVARIHSSSKTPKPDPVVQLEGGPGFGSLADIVGYSGSSVLAERDLILWDQRGTGFSTPSLNCTEADDAVWTLFTTTDEAKTEGGRLDESMRACKARIVNAGVDLDGYDTVQNAADLADLREALGVQEWNLRGVSYGSALAIEEMRSFPEGIHSVLLDSVVTPDGEFGATARGESALRSFGELRKACAADARCNTTYGDTDVLMAKAANALDLDPYPVDITRPDTGKVEHVQITGSDLYAGIFRAMYDEALIPVVPKVLSDIAAGKRDIIKTLAEQNIPFVTDQFEAMTTSVDCADRERLLDPSSVGRLTKAHPEVAGIVYLGNAEGGCAEWGVDPAPRSFNTMLTEAKNQAPVLVMAGRFDPITPPAGTRRVAKALGTEALFFVNAGHGAVGSSDCARSIYIAFMDDPTAKPDTSCMADLEAPTFA